MSKNSNNSTKKPKPQKPTTGMIVAKYTLIGTIVAAIIGLIGTCITAYVLYLGIQIPLKSTQTAESSIAVSSTNTPVIQQNTRIEITPSFDDQWPPVLEVIPTIGPMDYSPKPDFDPSNVSSSGFFLSSPYEGIYLSELRLDAGVAPSWYVHYDDEVVRPGEAKTCLINEGANLANEISQNGPLNIKAGNVTLEIVIFVDQRYTYDVTQLEVFVRDFSPQRENIEYLEIARPGAGGWTGWFQNVQTSRVWVIGKKSTSYLVDFPDFTLGPVNGVRIFIPLTMIDGGDYRFLVKIKGHATPSTSGEPGGELYLTSGEVNYGWHSIADPRNYDVKAKAIMTGEDIPVILVPCP